MAVVTLVRHGQADHNATENYHLRDPYLTKLGEEQCLAIPARFPAQPPVELLATSPLRRTVQTTLLGFAAQAAAGVPVVALAELQETSGMPCDTGSDAAELAADPRLAATATAAGASVVLDFSALPADWTSKAGRWAPAPGPLKARAQWVRRWLKDRPEAHVAVVLHGAFLHYLTEDWTGSKDFPGTGWRHAEFRHYTWAEGDEPKLVETAESRASRGDTLLDKAETKQLVGSHLKN